MYRRFAPLGRFLAWTRVQRASNSIRRFWTPAVASGTTAGLAISFFKRDKGVREGGEMNIELLIREADAFYDNYMIDNAWAILRRFERTDYSELLWRLARVLAEKGKITNDKEEKKILFLEALEYAEKAISNEPISGSFGAHKWYAIISNYVGEIEGTKEQIRRSYEVREHLERALEINPMDATTWHILGVWHFTFADMGTVTRLAAKAIYGTPPSSTYEEALRHFEHAEAIAPLFYKSNNFYLGEVYDRLGNKAKAIESYKKAFYGPIISVDDREAHGKALEKLKKFGVHEKELLDNAP